MRVKFDRCLWLLPLGVATALVVAVRVLLPFRLPVPWPDETWFVAPAYALSRTGSFFDAGINPDRVAMWMPPGYEILLAAVFRTLGYGFGIARGVSGAAALVSIGIIATLICRLVPPNRRLAASVVVLFAYASPNLLMSSNVARMDQVFACVILVAAALAVADHFYQASAVVAASALVHPNAVYFIPPMVFQFGYLAWRRQLRRPTTGDAIATTGDAIAMIAACVVLGSYAAYVAANYHGFVDDMRVQFAGRFAGHREQARWLWHLGAAMALVWAIVRARASMPVTMLAVFACASVAEVDLGSECWYDYAQPLGFALLTTAVLATPKSPRWLLVAAPLLTIVTACQIGDETPWSLPRLPPFRRDLVPAAELKKVRVFIAGLHRGDTVNFGGAGMEPFFLSDLAAAGAQWVNAAHSVTAFFPVRFADWNVRCDSQDFSTPEMGYDLTYVRVGADRGCNIYGTAKH